MLQLIRLRAAIAVFVIDLVLCGDTPTPTMCLSVFTAQRLSAIATGISVLNFITVLYVGAQPITHQPIWEIHNAWP